MLTIVAVVACGLSACAHQQDATQLGSCDAGTECAMEGKLQLHAGEPAWAAVLESGDKCAKLALPDGFYLDAEQWNGKRVSVSGSAFEQPTFDESNGTVMLWYTERDRKLALGMCDHGIGIYVESMRSSSGKKWSAPIK
jgi:hypothetical protein